MTSSVCCVVLLEGGVCLVELVSGALLVEGVLWVVEAPGLLHCLVAGLVVLCSTGLLLGSRLTIATCDKVSSLGCSC